MKSEEKKRKNYDDTPIVIKDYNSAFSGIMFKYLGLPIIVFILYIYPLISGVEIYYTNMIPLIIVIFPIMTEYNKSKDRNVTLFENTIKYASKEEKLSEVNLDKPLKFSLSFQNYYSKKQNGHFIFIIILYLMIAFILKSYIDAVLFLGIVFVIGFIGNQITKYIISDMGFKFFTSVLVQQEDEVVSIPIYKKKDYLDVKEYLSNRGILLEKLPIFFKPFYKG